MIERQLKKIILSRHKDGFIDIIYGPRRVGKTVLLQQLTEHLPKSGTIWLNGDDEDARIALSTTSQAKIAKVIKNYQTVVIDEAQRIENIGLVLKIMIDNYPTKWIYASGSSSLALAHGIEEPLTGRYQEYHLYPLSTAELGSELQPYQLPTLLPNQLLFGGYPYLEQLHSDVEKQEYLRMIVKSYLFRDLLLLKNIGRPEVLRKLATLLAFQVGSIVSLNELANNLGIDVKTVGNYINLLKQGFIIFELGSYSTNLRKEIAKSKKYYFWDLGIRNSLIGQFTELDLRDDKGQLWENFLAIERIKKNGYARKQLNYFFWRNYEQAEVDWLEQSGNKLSAYEFKYNNIAKTPKAFKDAYATDVQTINRDNYLEFIT